MTGVLIHEGDLDTDRHVQWKDVKTRREEMAMWLGRCRKDPHRSCQIQDSPGDTLISDFGPPELCPSKAGQPPVLWSSIAPSLVSSLHFPLSTCPQPQESILNTYAGSKSEALKMYVTSYSSSSQNPSVSFHLIQNRNQSPYSGHYNTSPYLPLFSPPLTTVQPHWPLFFPRTR